MRFWAMIVIGLVTLGLVTTCWLARPRQHHGPLITQVALPRPDVRLFFVGDTGTGDEQQYKVAAAMEAACLQAKPDGIVLLGDLFYMDGVTSEDDLQWQEKIWQPYSSPCLSQVSLYPVLGNHDVRGSIDGWFAQHRARRRWHFPQRFYRADFGTRLSLIAFDSNFPDWCGAPSLCAVDFITQQLDDPLPRWKVIFAHHPIISSSAKGGSHRGNLYGFLMQHWLCQADAYVAGHAHHMEVLEKEGCRAKLIVAGGGGGDLGELGEKRVESLFAEVSLGFLDLEAQADRLIWRFRNQDGQVIWQNHP